LSIYKLDTSAIAIDYWIAYSVSWDLQHRAGVFTVTEFIALQQFTPTEHQGERRCIWCKQEVPRNKAHIISKKLTLTSHQSAILKYSICPNCNSKCGQIESWILRKSPLGWIRLFCYLDSDKTSDSSAIPSYFYAEDEHEWLVYRLEGKKSNRTIDSQLILTKDKQLKLIAERAPDEQLDIIRNSIKGGKYKTDIRPTLPEDFSPRVLVDRDQIIVIARAQSEIDSIIDVLRDTHLQKGTRYRLQLIGSGSDRQHFQWSKGNWIKFCAKIAYETLCLFEGSGRCLQPEFEQVRTFVLAGTTKHYRELLFDEHGPIGQQDVPNTLVCVDLTCGQECPRDFLSLSLQLDPGMHLVVLYEIDGWICSSVSISGLPATLLVLGGPDAHLSDLYMLIYDDQMDEFDTVCLAYDPSQPVIPLPLQGHMSEALARTYKLTGKFD